MNEGRMKGEMHILQDIFNFLRVFYVFILFKFPILKQNFLRKYKRFHTEIFRKCLRLLKVVCKAKKLHLLKWKEINWFFKISN